MGREGGIQGMKSSWNVAGVCSSRQTKNKQSAIKSPGLHPKDDVKVKQFCHEVHVESQL